MAALLLVCKYYDRKIFPHQVELIVKNKLTLKIIFALLIFLLGATAFRYHHFCKQEIEAKVTAGEYILASRSMRELIYLRNGLENGEIKKGCFVHKRIQEVIKDADQCLSGNHKSCENYALEVASKDCLENYRSMKKNPQYYSGCN